MTAVAASLDGVIAFSDGVPGFEACREFVLVAAPALEPFRLVQGVGDRGPSFVTIDPRRVDAGYPAHLDAADLARLSARDGQPLLWLAIVASGPDGEATANLRAPLVINPTAMRGIQLITADSPYRVDHRLQVA